MGSHEEAEILRKYMRRGKNVAFSEEKYVEKVRVRSSMIPKKVGLRLKRRGESKKERRAEN